MKEVINRWYMKEYGKYPDYSDIYCVPLAYDEWAGHEVIVYIDLSDNRLYREMTGIPMDTLEVCEEDFESFDWHYLTREAW